MSIALIVGVAVVGWVIYTFNKLIWLRRLSDNAWSDIDVQLKRRHDLIPNVVSVVQGHAGSEKGTLEAVVAARGRAVQASQSGGGPAARAREEDPLGNALSRLLVVAEAYPELKAAASFAALQTTLTEVEDHLQNARRYYNAVVRDFNTAIAQFPTGIVAGMMRLQPREFFGLDDPSERAVPKVAMSIVLLLVALSGSSLAAQTQQKSYNIQRFDARIVVNKDASIDVTETITARFVGSWNGLFRMIPVQYWDAKGLNWKIGLTLESVRDGKGAALNSETSRERAYVKYKVWIPGAANADRTIVLRYHVTNGLRFFDEHDELYWNVTGDEWSVPIRRASADVILPAGAGGVRSIAYNGVLGSTTRDAKITSKGDTVRFVMPRELFAHEGLTVVVGWNKGVVDAPTAMDKVFATLGSNWPLFIPLIVLAVAFQRWARYGRDPRRNPIVVRYEPPENLSPAEAGTLLDNSVDMRDITATLMDLAVRGYLKIEEQDNPKLLGLFGGGTDYTLHRLKSGDGLNPHELAVYDGIFGITWGSRGFPAPERVFQSVSSKMSINLTVDGKDVPIDAKSMPAPVVSTTTSAGGGRERVPLEDLNQTFYSQLDPIRDAIWDRLIDNGSYRKRPEKMKAGMMRWGCALPFLIAIIGSVASPLFLMTPVPFIIAAVLTAIILMGFAQVMPTRTETGTRALEQVLGFAEFLRRVESEQYKQTIAGHPEKFDRFLPYAMAFGVEQQFARAFEGIYKEPPGWYAGPSLRTFNVNLLSRRVSFLEQQLRVSMSAAPRTAGTRWFSSNAWGSGGSSGGTSWMPRSSSGSGFSKGGSGGLGGLFSGGGGGGSSGGGSGGGGGGAF